MADASRPASDVKMDEAKEATREEKNPVPPERERRAFDPTEKYKLPVTRREGFSKQGTSGAVNQLMTNFIRVSRKSDDIIVQYRVDFDPANVTVPQRFRLIRQWAVAQGLAQSDFTFDRSNIIYTGPKGFSILKEAVTWLAELDGAPVTVKVYKVASLDSRNEAEFLQVLVHLNTQLNRFMEHELEMVRIMDTCFDPKKKIDVRGQPIEIWPGFETAIGRYDTPDLLMAIDQRFRIIRKQTAMEVIKDAYSSSKGRGRPDPECQSEGLKAIKGQVVETPYNHIAYKVDAIDWTKTPKDTFETRRKNPTTGVFEASTISYAEYFRNRYNQVVRDLNQPLLIVKPSNKAMRRKRDEMILLIPELCNMTGLTDRMKADFRLMKAVAEHTKLGPEPRRKKVVEFIDALCRHPQIKEQLESWGTRYMPDLVMVKGRTLAAFPIYQGDRKIPDYQRADWLTGIRSSPADKAGPTIGSNWLCLHFNQEQTARNFAKELSNVARPMGQNLGEPRFVDVGGATAQHFLNAAMTHGNAQIALVMAIFPDNAVDRYSAFKHQFCCTAPCITQVMLSKTISEAKSLKSVATKVAMQIIAKIGGLIWKLKFGFQEPTTVIGIDVHRDRQEKKMAVAACASWNRDISAYMNFSDYAEEDDDVHDVVTKLIKQAVEKFKEPNGGQFPAHVMIYRDGVSEGQLPNIVNKEIVKIREMLKTIVSPKPITLTYIMVNKRDVTRFFANPQTSVQGNPEPGTIVDDIVTRPFRFDFFIVSQTVREGTVAPTYYDVLVDDKLMTAELMQTCTYMLCHMYFNWPGTIRVPAPNQYARKHAQMVALNLHKPAADQLFSKMFYL